MSSSIVAICVDNLSKCYQIYDAPYYRLKQFIAPRLQRLAGKEQKKYFLEFWALRDVSFEVKKGETVGIIGCNGSGKSTLLQMICGTLYPTNGRIKTSGRVAALLELGSGFNPEFSGRENVYMNASVLGLSTDEINGKFDDIARFADIGNFLEQPVKTYSSGMMLRLAFAVIAHVDADILVVDEALAVGDVFFTQKCMRFLRNFMKNGTVLFVSHDIASIRSLCKSVIWIDKGIVQKIGTSKDVCDMYLERNISKSQLVNNNKDEQEYNDVTTEKSDHRLKYINYSKWRNDIEIFEFDPGASSFGEFGAVVLYANLKDKESNEELKWIVGGEHVYLSISVKAKKYISNLLIGFYLKDKTGQNLFGDNTSFETASDPLSVNVSDVVTVKFYFKMPILPVGEYSFCIAVGEGTQNEHIHHQWIHDALILKSITSSVSHGIVGIPIENIVINKGNNDE